MTKEFFNDELYGIGEVISERFYPLKNFGRAFFIGKGRRSLYNRLKILGGKKF